MEKEGIDRYRVKSGEGYYSLFDRISHNKHLDPLLKEKQSELIDVRKRKMDGVLVRSKILVRWMEDGEKQSRYFLNMEKRNFINKTISNIVKEDGSTITDSDAILLEAREFYKKTRNRRYLERKFNP